LPSALHLPVGFARCPADPVLGQALEGATPRERRNRCIEVAVYRI
jgi:hypothetical protein